MKKSHKGKKTPKHDIDLILQRYKVARMVHEELNATNPEQSFLKKYLGKYLPW